MAKETEYVALNEKIENLEEKFELLRGKVDLMETLMKSRPAEQPDEPVEKFVKVIQINTKEGKYFCRTPQQQKEFDKLHPGLSIESFTVEMPEYIAKDYLESDENKKFEKKVEEPINV